MLKDWLKNNPKYHSFLVSKPENIRYLTGFQGSFGWFLAGQDILISDGRYSETAKQLAVDFQLFDADFIKNFGDSITGKIACEDSLSLVQFNRLEKYFPKAKFTPQSGVVETLRRVKTDPEITKIATAQSHVDQVLLPFLKENLKTGVTEQALNFKLQQALQDQGKYGLSFPSIVAFGPHSSRPHHTSTNRKLKLGDNILIDCGVTFDGYCSDMTRNFIFGESSPEYLDKYKLLLDAQQRTQQKIIAGASTKNLDEFCRKALGDQSAYFTHSLGHGVGLEIHELPTLSTRSKDTLQVGEIVTNEPGLYYPEKFGIRIEDLLVVTESEPRVLSQFVKDLLSFDENGQVRPLVKAA